MTEAQFQDKVIELCEKHSVKYHHCNDSRHCVGHGFPDLVLVGKDRLVFVELKTATGTLSSKQTSWKYNLLAVGINHHVWRPSDLESGLIESYLSTM